MEGMAWSRPDRQSAHSVPILGGAEVIHNGRNGPGAARIAKALIVCQCQGGTVGTQWGEWRGGERPQALTTLYTNSCVIRPIQRHPEGGPSGRGGRLPLSGRPRVAHRGDSENVSHFGAF
jgi:hypothetical protein